MLNKIIFNTFVNTIKRLPKQRPVYSFSEKKREKDEDDDEYNNEEQDAAFKQDRNTTGWWIWRVIVYGTLGVFAHQIYNIANNKPKTVKQVDKKGNVVTQSVYPFVKIPLIFSMSQWIVSSSIGVIEKLTKPPAQKLLTDSFHPSLQPKTLVLNLTGTLLTSQYVIGKGRKLILRPNVDKLLERLSEKYQIVFWSNDDYYFIAETLPRMKNTNRIAGLFGKQCFTWTFDDGYQRNLKNLNRSLRNIVVVDNSLQLSKHYPNNVVLVSEFKGDMNDKQIEKLIGLLQKMAQPKVRDVRQVIKKLGENPLQKYSEVQNKVQQKQNQIKQKMGFWSKKTPKNDDE